MSTATVLRIVCRFAASEFLLPTLSLRQNSKNCAPGSGLVRIEPLGTSTFSIVKCILARTAGICPVSRCAKRLFNGPCGGSTNGKCEIDSELDCAWQLIVDRLKELDRMEDYEELAPIKGCSTERAGGPRKTRHAPGDVSDVSEILECSESEGS